MKAKLVSSLSVAVSTTKSSKVIKLSWFEYLDDKNLDFLVWVSCRFNIRLQFSVVNLLVTNK